MTLYEFNQMEDAEQMEAIWNSVYVADREDREYAILLYQIDVFYLEVYFDKDYKDYNDKKIQCICLY